MPRPSRIPEQVLELLRHGARHAWTMEQITSGLQAAGHQADFSSVWRAVERLLRTHALERVPLGDGATQYELAGAHHDHVRCVRCHALAAIDCVLHESELRSAERASGWSILEHRVVLDGLCPACRDAQAPRSAQAKRVSPRAEPAARDTASCARPARARR